MEDHNMEEQKKSVHFLEEDKENCLVNLNLAVMNEKIDRVVGRGKELERIVQVLCRRRKNNPILVGESGVGKTAIAEGLAFNIVEGNVPAPLIHSIIYSLDLGMLLSGTKYRGDFEKKLKSVLNFLESYSNSILFIDEIHTIIGAGAATGGMIDVANLLKPVLAKGNLRCIGATTYQEYHRIFIKDQALERRFQKIDVKEPSEADTVEMIKGIRDTYENYHKVYYSDAAIDAAVGYSKKYIKDKFLPDKAFDVIDEVGAYLNLNKLKRKSNHVRIRDIEQVISNITQLPIEKLSINEREKIQDLDKRLKKQIMGQNEAIDAVVNALKINRSGLGNKNKTIANFLFLGPTGVGKTELSIQMASIFGIELIRFDMSEYMEKHSVSKFIGSPPGYVGYEQGGLLTDAVLKSTQCVLLLDEIEKAHSDIFNILLQIMDYGVLTDNTGRKIDFTNVILIMTSNAGVAEIEKNELGFCSSQNTSIMLGDNLKNHFSPEFRNRLDKIVVFNSLSNPVMELILDKMLFGLTKNLKEKKIELQLDDLAKEYLFKKGFNPSMGARPLQRVINENITEVLANAIVNGTLLPKQVVYITLDEISKELDVQFIEKKRLEASGMY